MSDTPNPTPELRESAAAIEAERERLNREADMFARSADYWREEAAVSNGENVRLWALGKKRDAESDLAAVNLRLRALAALARLPQMEARIKELEAVLREVEWGGAVACGSTDNCGMSACPWCEVAAFSAAKHAPDCRLAAVLAGKE